MNIRDRLPALVLVCALGCNGGPTREQAEASVKNMVKICIAANNHEADKREFPLRALPDKDGKPGLSWRVAVLPYLGEKELYAQFKMDQPWDSPSNKPLLAKMPKVFQSPVAKAEPGQTNYVTVTAPLGVFGEGTTTTLAGVRDGTDNTVMLVEADVAVPWTKPEDYAPDSANPLAGLGGLHPKGAFLLCTVSGKMHFLLKTIDPKVFMSLTTRRGNEIMAWDALDPGPSRSEPSPQRQ